MTLFDFFILKILFAKLAGFNISAFPPSLFIAFTKLADVIFVVLCIANQTGIDIQKVFDKKLKYKTKRDKNRHLKNPKL